jgi:aspartate kinase
VVSCGEMISTKIVSEYLNEIQFTNQWLDARDYVKQIILTEKEL